MLAYYGYTISPNQIETGEGFLICRNVPIARTGDQEYLGRELGISGTEAEKIITVHRSPEEVFSEAALASFEGKPVTDEHPPELLDPDNVARYLKGHAEQIRKGTGDWDGYVIADLHIQDRSLIEAVQCGKREISCGYECEYVDHGDGTYSQRNIRGNHIAVVTRGRAGKRAAILDSVNKDQAEERPERKKMKKNGLLLKLFGLSVKDKSPEEIEQMAQDTADALEEGGEKKSAAKEDPDKNTGIPTADEKAAKVFSADEIQKIVDTAVKNAMKDAKEEEKEKGDAIDEAIKKLEEDGAEQKEEAKVVPAEEMDQEKAEKGLDSLLAVEILKKLQPSVAAIKDEKERKAVADAIISTVTGNDSGDIAKIVKAAQKNAKKTADHRADMSLEESQKAYDALNPHKNGGKKE